MSKLTEMICPDVSFEESGYSTNDEDYWSARSLYAQAELEEAKPYPFPLKHFDFSSSVWPNVERLTDMAYHFRRALKADLSIPIIVGPLGNVLDGYHRILKAVVMEEKVMAYRLKELPASNIHPHPDSEVEEEK
jgi:hypothetical protein